MPRTYNSNTTFIKISLMFSNGSVRLSNNITFMAGWSTEKYYDIITFIVIVHYEAERLPEESTPVLLGQGHGQGPAEVRSTKRD